jgi:hypothetical protein
MLKYDFITPILIKMEGNFITIYSIGHGRHSFADFLNLLQKYEIKFLCDVRNYARSRWAQFNQASLSENLRENGIGYEHLPECGGKKIALPEDLNRGIERTLEISAEVKTVMMCSESQPAWGVFRDSYFYILRILHRPTPIAFNNLPL